MTEYTVDTLNNGVRLVTVPMPHLHSAELVCYLDVGGRCEPVALSGISHFLEHMIFRGTAEYRDSVELERAFEAIGGAVNASTDVETTCFHSRVHPDFTDAGVALFASMLRRPKFADLDIERRIILEEAREDYNEKGQQINQDNLMADLLWPEHPLGASLIGSPDTLGAIDLVQLKDYYRSWYLPQNLVICACGPVERPSLLDAVTREFGDWDRGLRRTADPAPDPTGSGPNFCWVNDSDSQIGLQLGFPLPGRRDPRTTAVRLLRRILSWGGGARLPLRLREELGLTYSVEASCSLLDDAGYLAIDLSVAPKNLSRAVSEVIKVLVEMREKPVPEEEFSRTVNSYLFDIEFSRDQTEAMAVRYGWGLQVGYLRTLAEDRRELQSLKPSDLQNLAGEFLCSKNLHLVVVGPWTRDDRRIVERLVAGF